MKFAHSDKSVLC